jgi:hypothetical protein
MNPLPRLTRPRPDESLSHSAYPVGAERHRQGDEIPGRATKAMISHSETTIRSRFPFAGQGP